MKIKFDTKKNDKIFFNFDRPMWILERWDRKERGE
jgi:hypothetical protein